MGNGDADADEPEKKRRLLTAVSSSPMARSTNGPLSPDDKAVDAAALQYQNQILVQLLEAQKSETHALEKKFKELEEKQDVYDETLIAVNKLWNQLVDDLILLKTLAGGDPSGLQALDEADISRGVTPSCPPEETFLCRLLQAENIEKSKQTEIIKYIQEALAVRHSSTMVLMRGLQEAIDAQQTKLDGLELAAHGNLSSEDAFIQLQKLDSLLKEEAKNLLIVINFLHKKHKEYAQEVQAYVDNHARDQSEIKRLSDLRTFFPLSASLFLSHLHTSRSHYGSLLFKLFSLSLVPIFDLKGELEEAMAELEETRRKVVSLKMQKDGMCRISSPTFIAVNGNSSPEKQNISLRELKNSVEEAKILAAARLSELQEAQENNSSMSKQLEALKDQLRDDRHVSVSRPYLAMNEKLQHLNTEIERCRGLADTLQADRNHMIRREKELGAKADSADAARNAIIISNAKIEELELQLHKCILERNEIEIKLEEAVQDSGRKDFKDEIHVMASALSREMELMEMQLNRCMEAAREAVSLREEASSLEALLKTKIDKLEKEKEELQNILDMYGQECFDNRTIVEIKESEHRAHMQAEMLRSALDEHNLELRVKAANEAELACQKRLSAAVAEIADLKEKLDSSERELLELREAIIVKDAEAAAYISEIETIGQAYEDMQTQNQHLQQQVVDRDDYNIKLVSESVKMRQMHGSLLSEKQAMAKQLQQATSSIEFVRTKISRGEDQMKTLLAQAEKVSVENRHLTLNTEKTRLELVETEKDLKWLKSAFESSEKELEQNQQKATKLRTDLDDERTKGKKLKEELERVTSLLERMSPENEAAATQRLQDEIKECKAILKCGVCFDRPKQVVITKCFHLFCSNCIQRNLEIRHRKCPACGTPFGQNDVKEVNI
ncbi:unnamed protein product [Spirodela intermedia]|uniref:E3 ubiquitin protein ligase n=1 Tax=Spirodela intermedia TaxID=51605 RepID=A0A7I8J5I8_SPIIN|nr:unnamed protein product [Spirodela intermedia]CAA6664692.1 unnamed protein product [Spirodela intermedia]